MYDTKFATPVSKAEVTMDNNAYQTVTDPSVYVKFKLKDSKTSHKIVLNEHSKVLFVCNANVVRSQMAQAFYNHFTHAGLSGGGALPGNVLPGGPYGGVLRGLECVLLRLFQRAAGPRIIFALDICSWAT